MTHHMDLIDLMIYLVIILLVVVPVIQQAVDSGNYTGTNALIVGVLVTLVLVLAIVKITQSMKKKN